MNNPTPADAEKLEGIFKAVINNYHGGYANYIGELTIESAVAKLQALIDAARQETIDHVYKLSPTAQFKNWKPQDALRFYERLKAYEQELSHPAPVHKSDKE